MGGACTLQTRKFITNRLLARRQFVVDVLHPGRSNVSKEELTEKVAKMYSVKDKRNIILFGFRTQFGGGPRASPGARIRAWLPSRALNSSTSAGVTYIPTNNLVAAGGNARVNRITITPSSA